MIKRIFQLRIENFGRNSRKTNYQSSYVDLKIVYPFEINANNDNIIELKGELDRENVLIR